MGRKAVLIIHGFGSGPWENEYLAMYLQLTKKYDVYTFTLPGHTTRLMVGAKYTDWIDKSEQVLKKLLGKYRKVYLIGHSMGGVIATYLAGKYPVKKLVVIAGAFKWTNFKQNGEDFINSITGKKEKILNYEVYKDIFSGIFRISSKALLEFVRLTKNYYDSPKKVKCNTLVIQGDSDEFVKCEVSEKICDELSSKRKTLLILKDVKHRVFLSDKKEEVCFEINKFLRGGLRWKKKIKYEI